jgi:phosphohistidine phosphatase
MRTMMLLRHAKSDWDSGVADDFDRPLAKRGRGAAQRMAAWMQDHGVVPEYVLSSTAVRARETTTIVANTLALDAARLEYQDRLYLADVDELLLAARDCPKAAKSVMLVGHNPGLEDLLTYLCGEELPSAANGKLMPTAALARIALPDNWKNLRRDSGDIIAITRPKEL